MKTYVRFVGLKSCKNCGSVKAMKETDPPGTCFIKCCGKIQSERRPGMAGLHREVR